MKTKMTNQSPIKDTLLFCIIFSLVVIIAWGLIFFCNYESHGQFLVDLSSTLGTIFTGLGFLIIIFQLGISQKQILHEFQQAKIQNKTIREDRIRELLVHKPIFEFSGKRIKQQSQTYFILTTRGLNNQLYNAYIVLDCNDDGTSSQTPKRLSVEKTKDGKSQKVEIFVDEQIFKRLDENYYFKLIYEDKIGTQWEDIYFFEKHETEDTLKDIDLKKLFHFKDTTPNYVLSQKVLTKLAEQEL